MEACKQQNYGCLQAAEQWIVVAYGVHVAKTHCTSCCNKNTSCLLQTVSTLARSGSLDEQDESEEAFAR